MNKITKEIWKNNILHYGIIILFIFVVGYVSATTITNNRISNVVGTPMEITDKIINVSLSDSSHCNINSGSLINAFDGDLDTFVELTPVTINGYSCGIVIDFDKNYSITGYWVSGKNINSENDGFDDDISIDSYSFLDENIAGGTIFNWYPLDMYYSSPLFFSTAKYLIIWSESVVYSAPSTTAKYYEFKFYGIDIGI